MQAEIIAIGDEILIGQTIDTNSSFIARHLNAAGIQVRQKRVIADEKEAIKQALDTIHSDTKLVFITGGLGPTKDDITKHTLMEYFGGKLVYHANVFEHIEKLFAGFGRVPNETNRGQAYVPSSCTPIKNKLGTAPGMRFEKGCAYYFSLPGVPYETERLIEKEIMPWVNEHLQGGTVVHQTVLTQGVPESELAEKIQDWETALPEDLQLAYLPSAGMVKLRLSSYKQDPQQANQQMDEAFAQLPALLGDILFGKGAESLQEVIGIELQKRKLTMATAESCTGGYIAHLITSVPGSSAYFKGSVVSYANEVKTAFLNVKQEDIQTLGAVSEEVVLAMAKGVQEKMQTDFAIATSGVAGPGGGSDQKPVGTVWIALASPEGVRAKKFAFGRNRERNIRKTTLMGMDWLRKEVQKIK
jgi:nicotinamide-nucleotide amidase